MPAQGLTTGRIQTGITMVQVQRKVGAEYRGKNIGLKNINICITVHEAEQKDWFPLEPGEIRKASGARKHLFDWSHPALVGHY